MAEHEDHIHADHVEDAERQRQIALEEFRRLRGKYAHQYEGPDPAREQSEAMRRLLAADDPYEGMMGVLMEGRQMSSGNLDLAALAQRRLRALRGVKERGFDNLLCIAAADLVIEALASRLVLEARLASEGRELDTGASSATVRDFLATAIEDTGDDDVYELMAMALRRSGHPDPVAELREVLGL